MVKLPPWLSQEIFMFSFTPKVLTVPYSKLEVEIKINFLTNYN